MSDLEKSLVTARLGTVQANPNQAYLAGSMNTWFHTQLFDQVKATHGILLRPTGSPDQDRIHITVFQFPSDTAAGAAVGHMDRHGLTRVAYLPPANWFWIGFRDCVVFLSCNGMRVDELPYQDVIKIVLMQIHLQRVVGGSW